MCHTLPVADDDWDSSQAGGKDTRGVGVGGVNKGEEWREGKDEGTTLNNKLHYV